MRRPHRGNHLTHYQCNIIPRLWFLGLRRNHRIFQHKSVPEAERYAEIQLRRQLAPQIRLEAESDVSRFLPGFTFTLFGYDMERLNAGWWVTEVTHHGEQPQVLEHEAAKGHKIFCTVCAEEEA